MGDRANVLIKGDDGNVFLYTHWAGSELATTVHKALARRQRWGDTPYLRRIIFGEMVRDCANEETGYGIGATIGDNEHPIVVVDDRKQTISLAPKDHPTRPGKAITYEAFVADASTLGYH